ncbi:LysR family transcriptional regulator [Trinickia sp.]|uniref:LysR family transcriptional regulator n=1 Tax=Trinickia sp. TaxID=2571163 RepID=UPI003F7E55FE
MELRHIRYFLAVAEERNVTRAAEKLGIGQPPLSQQIHALEAELDVRLFRRTGHGVVLTEAGETFLVDARRLLESAGQAIANAQSAGRGETGQLNIGFTGSAAFNPIVPRMTRQFRQSYPGVTLTLSEGNTAELLDDLKAGRVDVAFVRLGAQSPAGMTFHHIAAERMRLVLPATHRLARKQRIKLEMLAGEPFVLLPRDVSPTLHDVIVGACRQAGFEPVLGQQAPQLSSVVNFVAAEFGVSLVPASVCQIQVEGVVYADVAGANITIRLALASQAQPKTSKVENFLAIARQLTAPLEG